MTLQLLFFCFKAIDEACKAAQEADDKAIESVTSKHLPEAKTLECEDKIKKLHIKVTSICISHKLHNVATHCAAK